MHLRDGNVAIGGSISHMSATNQTASVMCMSRVSAVILDRNIHVFLHCDWHALRSRHVSFGVPGSTNFLFGREKRDKFRGFSCSCILSCAQSSPTHMLAQADTAMVSVRQHTVLVAVERCPSVCGCSVCGVVQKGSSEGPRVRRHDLVWS